MLGRTGGLPFVGVGWYRIKFEVPGFSPGKQSFILFDGAMSQQMCISTGTESESGLMDIILFILILHLI